MKYLLNTNACIQFITGRSLSIKEKIENVKTTSLVICSIIKGELKYGARKSNNPEKTISILENFLSNFTDISYNSAAAEQYGIIRAELEKKSLPIGSYDLQIAAIALANNLILVTHNTKEFERFDGLVIEDWEIL